MQKLLTSANLQLYPKSIVNYQDVEYGMAHSHSGAQLVVLAPNHSTVLEAYEGEISEFNHRTMLVGPTSAQNTSSLRDQLAWLRPIVLGLNTSAGMGDSNPGARPCST
jgi:hypothetical protein